MILKRLVVGPYASNCYIIGSEKTREGIIIDPGAEADKIMAAVEESGLTIKLIIVTHGHIDHVGAFDQVRTATKAPAAMHANDAGERQEEPGKLQFLKDEDTIEIGDMRFTVLHTPGHSSGGISLYGHGIVFSGDTLFNFGIGRYDLPSSDYQQLVTSLNRLISLPEDTSVLPGHGPDTTVAAEKRGNPFLRF
ncbi:MBL fold metallo-hydrolase [Chloroflexota bacterium]